MYSSFDPVFQPALLSKASGNARSAISIDDMRENEYVQHAIITGVGPCSWATAREGCVFPVCPTRTSASSAHEWARLSVSQPGSNHPSAAVSGCRVIDSLRRF
jgi:hypothetical protein